MSEHERAHNEQTEQQEHKHEPQQVKHEDQQEQHEQHEQHADEHPPEEEGPQFAPIVSLPVVQVPSGEEEEIVLLKLSVHAHSFTLGTMAN